MIRDNFVVGGLIVAVCIMVFSKERWFLETTNKGQLLVRWFGPERAPWALRGILGFGVVFGSLLAMSIIRPIQWH